MNGGAHGQADQDGGEDQIKQSAGALHEGGGGAGNTMARVKRKATRPLPSLTRLSASSSSVMRRGRPRRLAVAVAAWRRGGDDGTENKAETPIEAWNEPVDGGGRAEDGEATKPKASMTMLRILRRNSRHEIWNAARKSRGGRMTRKTTSGLSETRGACGSKLRKRPPTTMTMG